jgi:hypothetical protein
MRRILRENGLSIVLFVGFFTTFLVGQSLTGHKEYNNDQQEHGQPPISFSQYLKSGHFLEATTENWESEFLQMGLYVLLTAYLYQKGSSESKKLDEKEAVDRDPRKSRDKKDAPWPVRKGGFVLVLYENSLFLAFMILFLISFWFHAVGGARVFSEEQMQHGGQAVSTIQYMGTSRFWFESLQNWQSEFLAIFAMVTFSIFLRQKGSPESKPVDAPHGQTGTE